MRLSPRFSRRAWPLGLAAVALACGRPPPVAAPPLDPEELELDADGTSIAGIPLPRLPLDVEPEDLGEGWDRTVAALLMPAPRPPEGAGYEVEAWASEQLPAWMERRARAIGLAQRALEESRGGPAPESVVASTLLGLAYTRFALDLRGLETPDAFAASAERRAAFRAALETAARPLWERAVDAFGSCSHVAASAPAHTLARWREHCDAELRAAAAMMPGMDDDDDDDDEDD